MREQRVDTGQADGRPRGDATARRQRVARAKQALQDAVDAHKAAQKGVARLRSSARRGSGSGDRRAAERRVASAVARAEELELAVQRAKADLAALLSPSRGARR